MRCDTGTFRGRRALFGHDTGGPEADFGPGAGGGDMETVLWPVAYCPHYLGFAVLPALLTFGVQGHGYACEAQPETEDRLRRRLELVGKTLAEPWRRSVCDLSRLGGPGR